jgi:hypothetical protein
MPSTLRLPARLPAALLLLAGALVLAGCRELPRIPPGILYDPQMGPAEQSYFEQAFDERPATVRLGPGWFEAERSWGDGHDGVAWAGRAARLYFARPLAPRVDLVALAVPLVYTGAPRQTVTPLLNGRVLPNVAMAADWSELRIPLPADALVSTVNILDLLFAYEAVPARVGLGKDDRALAAAFDQVDLLPCGEPLLQARSLLRGGQRAGRELVLRGEPAAVPLPPATRYEIRLGAVRRSPPGARRFASAFHVVAGVDNDPKVVGRRIGGFTVRPSQELAQVVPESGAEIGVLAVPAEAAQENYDALAEAGIRGVLNFAPVRVKRRAGVFLKNVDLRINLEELAFFLRG